MVGSTLRLVLVVSWLAGLTACSPPGQRSAVILDGEPREGLGTVIVPVGGRENSRDPSQVALGAPGRLNENRVAIAGVTASSLIRDGEYDLDVHYVRSLARYGLPCGRDLEGVVLLGALGADDIEVELAFLRRTANGRLVGEPFELPSVDLGSTQRLVGCLDPDTDGRLDVFMEADDLLHHFEQDAAGDFLWVESHPSLDSERRLVGASDAGDVNGDGFSDLLVVNRLPPFWDPVSTLFLGGNSGLSAIPVWETTAEYSLTSFHNSMPQDICAGGDVDADGFEDLLLGRHLFLGGPAGLEATPAWEVAVIEQDEKDDNERWDDLPWLGIATACGGDLNGDGFDDVLLGAPGFNGRRIDTGRVFFYPGGPEGLSPEPAWELDGHDKWEFFGQSLAFIDDLDGDGDDELLVGAPGYGNKSLIRDTGLSGNGDGRVYLFLGEPTD